MWGAALETPHPLRAEAPRAAAADSGHGLGRAVTLVRPGRGAEGTGAAGRPPRAPGGAVPALAESHPEPQAGRASGARRVGAWDAADGVGDAVGAGPPDPEGSRMCTCCPLGTGAAGPAGEKLCCLGEARSAHAVH